MGMKKQLEMLVLNIRAISPLLLNNKHHSIRIAWACVLILFCVGVALYFVGGATPGKTFGITIQTIFSFPPTSVSDRVSNE